MSDPGNAVTCFYMSPFAGVGGTQEYITMLACRMSRHGQVKVMLPFDPAQLDRFKPRLIAAGAQCISLPEDLCALFAVRRYDRRWRGGARLASLILGNWDAPSQLFVHSNIDPVSLAALASGLGGKAAIVNTFHDFGRISRPSVSYPVNTVLSMLYLRRAIFITPSKAVKQELLNYIMAVNGPQVRNIPTGIDELPSIAPSTRHDPVRFTLMSRVAEAKAPDVFLNGVEQFRSAGGRAEFRWIGGGPMLDWAKAETLRRRLASEVQFLGYLEDAQAILRESDMFLLSSLWEGGCAPRGVLEAISRGFPCVLPAIASIQEALGADDEAALYYEPGNAASLAQALQRAVADSAAMTQRARRARRKFLANHLADQEFERTLSVYLEALRAPAA
jgi:glycosyltransferase involved in cell wall biosynthesis